jgi:hypothetical protein
MEFEMVFWTEQMMELRMAPQMEFLMEQLMGYRMETKMMEQWKELEMVLWKG